MPNKIMKLIFVVMIVLMTYALLLVMIVDDSTFLPSWILAYRMEFFILFMAIDLFGLISLIK